MRILRLSLVDFRNYAGLEFEPGPGANVLLGPNGAGKTNILEALHLVLTGFSHRAVRDREMLRHNCTAFSVRARVERDLFAGDPLDYQISFVGGRKAVRRGGKELTGRARSQAIGAAVVFSPDDLDLVKGSPGGRRDYLDLVLAKADSSYRTLSRRYEAALAQRNRVLSECPPPAHATGRSASPVGRLSASDEWCDLLRPWTEQLITAGAAIMHYRLRGLARLGPLAAAAYSAVAGGREALELAYLPGSSDADLEQPLNGLDRVGLEGFLRSRFAVLASAERGRRVTLAGPHRDDVLLTLDATPARTYGSQGQQRSVALALRLAEVELLEAVLGERPLLLLDDVFSELDEQRRGALLGLLHLAERGNQTFVTVTDLMGLPMDRLGTVAAYSVGGGTISHAHGA